MNGALTLQDVENGKIAIAENAKLRVQVASLRRALRRTIATVDCPSLDENGTELPWYVGARMALEESGGFDV